MAMTLSAYLETARGQEMVLVIAGEASIPTSIVAGLILKAFPDFCGREAKFAKQTFTKKLKLLAAECRASGMMTTGEFLRLAKDSFRDVNEDT